MHFKKCRRPESATRCQYANRHAAEGLPCSLLLPGLHSNHPLHQAIQGGLRWSNPRFRPSSRSKAKSPGGRLIG